MRPATFLAAGAIAAVLAPGARCPALAAEEPAIVKSPLSPAESLSHLFVSPGLKVELAAHEPQIVDPVAIRFDEDGRMWVVEMRDYPTGAAEGAGGSRISVLKDRDSDGFFETATVFAENLRFATGVQPWRGGVFVTMAGQVAYMKDTGGDGRADVNEVWFTGFAEKNTQLRANDPRLALDNYIYVANGLRGGAIVDARRPGSKPVSISGMDFRFDPLTGKCEGVSGAGQFGMTFDDYGNRFVCTNRNPAIHVVLENRFLKKNPLVAVPAVVHDVAKAGDQSRLYPIARSWTTSNLHAGQFTAACGVEVYRGDALPAEYYGNIFTCDPTAHLVHREILAPAGVTFRSTPVEEGREFLASRDSWFSPVNLEVGPDGSLYVVDMYRAVIEHPEWMPEELRQRPDLLAGNDRGRIYRVVHADDVPRRFFPRLGTPSSAELVNRLSDRNAWHRLTAARLLLERQDKGAAAQLQELTRDGSSPLGRIHAMRALEGMGLLTDDVLLDALDDESPQVVEQAITAAESRSSTAGELRERLIGLCHHADARVRFAALLAVAPHPVTPTQAVDEWEEQALLIAAGNQGGMLLAKLLADTASLEANLAEAPHFVAQVARLAAASGDDRQWKLAATALLGSQKFRRAGLASFLGEVVRGGAAVDALRAKLDEPARRTLDRTLREARDVATSRDQPDDARCDALELAAFGHDRGATVAALAIGEPSQAVRLRAIALLGAHGDFGPLKRLVAGFSSQSPAVQRAILDVLLARDDRTGLLLVEIDAGRVKATALDAARMTRLLQHQNAAIRRRAGELFAAALPADRRQVLADYQTVLTMTGNPLRGRDVFAKHCATCHRIGEIGVNVAPDISDSREKTAQQCLTDILQPNRAIDANYFSTTVVTTEGLALTGILTAETATSITLREAAGKETMLRRDEIEQLQSNGVSLMPEGLEREISPPDMADLIAFIKNWRYLDGQTPVAP